MIISYSYYNNIFNIMYIIIMINIIHIIKIIKIIFVLIVNKNIYINNNIEFTHKYRFVVKICG